MVVCKVDCEVVHLAAVTMEATMGVTMVVTMVVIAGVMMEDGMVNLEKALTLQRPRK